MSLLTLWSISHFSIQKLPLKDPDILKLQMSDVLILCIFSILGPAQTERCFIYSSFNGGRCSTRTKHQYTGAEKGEHFQQSPNEFAQNICQHDLTVKILSASLIFRYMMVCNNFNQMQKLKTKVNIEFQTQTHWVKGLALWLILLGDILAIKSFCYRWLYLNELLINFGPLDPSARGAFSQKYYLL